MNPLPILFRVGDCAFDLNQITYVHESPDDVNKTRVGFTNGAHADFSTTVGELFSAATERIEEEIRKHEPTPQRQL
jgi:hypothetical protein